MDLSDGSDVEEELATHDIDENDLLGGSDDEDHKILNQFENGQLKLKGRDLEDNDGDYLDLATGDDDELSLHPYPTTEAGQMVAPVKVRNVQEKLYMSDALECTSTSMEEEENTESMDDITCDSTNTAGVDAEDEGMASDPKPERSRFQTERKTLTITSSHSAGTGSPIRSLGFHPSPNPIYGARPRHRLNQPRNFNRPEFLHRPGFRPRQMHMPRMNGSFRGRMFQMEPMTFQFQEQGIFTDFSDPVGRKQMPHLMLQPPPPKYRFMGHAAPPRQVIQPRPAAKSESQVTHLSPVAETPLAQESNMELAPTAPTEQSPVKQELQPQNANTEDKNSTQPAQSHPTVIITRMEPHSPKTTTHENNLNVGTPPRSRPPRNPGQKHSRRFNNPNQNPSITNAPPNFVIPPRPPFQFRPPLFAGQNNQFYGGPQPPPEMANNHNQFMPNQAWGNLPPFAPPPYQMEQQMVHNPPFPANFQHPDFLNFFQPQMGQFNPFLAGSPPQFLEQQHQQQSRLQFNPQNMEQNLPPFTFQDQRPNYPGYQQQQQQMNNNCDVLFNQHESYYRPPQHQNQNPHPNMPPATAMPSSRVDEMYEHESSHYRRDRDRDMGSPAKRRIHEQDEESFREHRKPRLQSRLGPPPNNSQSKEAEIVKIILETKKEMGIKEDDEYLNKIEEQKRKREVILRMKEQRRKGLTVPNEPPDSTKQARPEQIVEASGETKQTQSIYLNPKTFNGDLLSALNTNLKKINMNANANASSAQSQSVQVAHSSKPTTGKKPEAGTRLSRSETAEQAPSTKKGRTILRVVKNKKGEIISKSKVVVMRK